MFKEKYNPIIFPKDEQKHNHIIEWWYFNGNLKTKEGKTFSYMNCLFNTKPKKVKIPFLDKLPIKDLYFSHSLLSDNKNIFKHRIDPICLLNEESFKKDLLWVMYNNSSLINEYEPFKYHLVNDFVDLNLTLNKKPLLLKNKGFLDLKIKTTYYYSLTSLKTKGFVKYKNKWIPVEGLSWMDHQWAQTPLTADDEWKWYSIQLDNKTEIVCFKYGNLNQTFHASMIDKDNNIKTTDKVIFEKIKKPYISKKTHSEYELDNKIIIPAFNLELESKPFKKNQEMIFGSINYWEGGVEFIGKIDNKKVKGTGFLEITNTNNSMSNLDILKNEFRKNSIRDKLKAFTKISSNFINSIID